MLHGSRVRHMGMLCACLALSGCLSPTPGAGPAGNDGVAEKMSLGISPAEAEVAMGFEAGFERNPNNWDEACYSYGYGDSPKRYVHAVYRQNALVRATDGHSAICTYGTLVSG